MTGVQLVWVLALTGLSCGPAQIPARTSARAAARAVGSVTAADAEDYLRSHNPELKELHASPVDGFADRFVSIRGTVPSWWGTFACLRADGAAFIAATGVGDDMPTEQSILSVRGLRHSELRGPLVEVFGQTHMGNGNCYLYEWEGDRLRCLLSTWAVDRHTGDASVIRGGRLDVRYEDANGDGDVDVMLAGTIDRRSSPTG